VLHYLETLRPQQLLEQMVCTAFKSSADILNKTTYGGFKLMKTKMDQLYATMASTLKSLQGTSNYTCYTTVCVDFHFKEVPSDLFSQRLFICLTIEPTASLKCHMRLRVFCEGAALKDSPRIIGCRAHKIFNLYATRPLGTRELPGC